MRHVRIALALAGALVASYALWIGAISLTARLHPPTDDNALRGAILGLNVGSARILVVGAGLFMSALHLLAVGMTERRSAVTALAVASALAAVPVAIDYAIARAVDRALGAGTHVAVWAGAALAMAAIAWSAFLLMRETAPPPPSPRPPDPGRTSLG